MGSFIDLTGKRFGRLSVIRATRDRYKSNVIWECLCDCGATKHAPGHFLRYGEVKSCGCLTADMLRERNTTHGLSRHPAYKIWCAIHKRCSSDSDRRADYFDRGIMVCERWSTFEAFWDDMGSEWKPGLTLDRLDNDRGYSPDNCAWRDYRAQANNTRRNRWVDTPRGRMTVAQAAREFGVRYPTLHNRVKAGLSGDALFAPIKNGGRDGDEEQRLVAQIADLERRLAILRAEKAQALSSRNHCAAVPVVVAT